MLDSVPIVRLVRTDLIEMEHATAAVAGLTPAGSVPVGFGANRVVGFPGWAVINDSEHAAIALSLVPELQKAEKLAATRVKKAKTQFAELSKHLEEQAPHFLPTFWEEAARIFLRADNQNFAAQMFSRAREVERTHALPIDGQRHAAAFEEFIAAGAVTAKELTAEAKALSQRRDSQGALDGYVNLVQALLRAGQAPYAGLPKDLRGVAKAAGKDISEVEAPIVRDFVNSPSMTDIPIAAWKTWAPTVTKLVATGSAVADALLSTIPTFGWEEPSESNLSQWFDYMNKVGLTDRLATGTTTPVATRWVRKAVSYFDSTFSDKGDDKTAGLRTVLSQMTQLQGQPITINKGIDACLFEALVAAGMIPEFSEFLPDPRCVGFFGWSKQAGMCDFPALAAFGTANPSLFDHLQWLRDADRALANPGSTVLLEGYVGSFLHEREFTYSDFADVMLELTQMLDSDESRAHFAEEFDQLRRMAPGPEVLAATLRQGLLSEYAWPAVQEAIDELVAEQQDNGNPTSPVVFHPSWPWMGVSIEQSGHVIFVRGDERGPEASFATVRSNSWSAGSGPNFLLVDGQVVCRFGSIGNAMAWANDPGNEIYGQYTLGFDDRSWTFETSDGRLAEGGVVRVGEPNNEWAGNYLTDGESFWRALPGQYRDGWRQPGVIKRINSDTGAEQEISLPDTVAAITQPYRRKGFELDADNIYWLPEDNFPAADTLVVREGIRGWVPLTRHKGAGEYSAVSTYLFPDETAITGPRYGKAAIKRPGGGMIYHFGSNDSRGSSRQVLTAHDEKMREIPLLGGQGVKYHWIHWLPVSGFAHLSSRDEAASQRLRGITADDVAELYDVVAVRADPFHGYRDTNRKQRLNAGEELFTVETIKAAQKLLGTDDSTLVESVVTLAAQVKYYRELLGDGDARPPKAAVKSGQPEKTPNNGDDIVLRWYETLDNPLPDYSRRTLQTAANVVTLAEMLSGESHEEGVRGLSNFFDLALTHPELLITLAVTPRRPIEDAEVSLNLAELILDSGVYTENVVSFVYEHHPKIHEFDLDTGEPIALPGGGYAVIWRREGIVMFIGISPSGTLPPDKRGYVLTQRWRSSGLSVDVLRQALAAAREKVADARDQGGIPTTDADRQRAGQLAEKTGWDLSTAQLFLAGLPGEWNHHNDMEKRLLGKGVDKQALATARARFVATGEDIIAEMLMAASADPVDAVNNGLDVDAAVKVWDDEGMVTELTDADVRLAGMVDTRYLPLPMLQPRLRASDDVEYWRIEPLLLMYVSLAQKLAFDSPARQWLAGEMEWLYGVATSITVEFESMYDVGTMLGLGPADKWSGDIYEDGPWTLNRADPYRFAVTWEPSKVEDWDAEVARLSLVPELKGRRFIYTPGYREFLEWLRMPLVGNPHDPAVSVPELVDAVASEYDVSTDAARYYLQLLALHDPTDANVQEWNGWKKKDRVAAAGELVEKGLVVEAKRARARRSYFLPGGWKEAKTPHLPMEAWKAQAFQLADEDKVEPTVFEVVLPLRPFPQLFTDAWDRLKSGDKPGA